MQRDDALHPVKYILQLTVTAAAVALGGCAPVDEAPVTSPAGGEGSGYIAAFPSEGRVIGDYVYAGLSEREKAAYDALREAVRAMESVAYFAEVMTPEELLKIYKLVYTQESDIFWLSSFFARPSEPVGELALSYRYDAERTAVMKGELELAAGVILAGLPRDCAPYDALLYFHDTIVTNCSFSDESEHSNSAYGSLSDGYAQCEGYAFGFSFLCDKAGIENIVVTGRNAAGDTHAWNKVRFGGAWYNIDCTWDDPVLKRDSPDFVRHDYFLVPDADIVNISHFQDIENFFPPICGSGDMTYFIVEGLYFTSLQDGMDGLAARIRKQALLGKSEVGVRFSDKVYYGAAKAKLFDEDGLPAIISSVNKATGTQINSAYKLTNDDLCVIHLSLVFAD
jgi:hypothetical protein